MDQGRSGPVDRSPRANPPAREDGRPVCRRRLDGRDSVRGVARSRRDGSGRTPPRRCRVLGGRRRADAPPAEMDRAQGRLAPAAGGARTRHPMPFGAEVLPEGGVRFALWAPAASRVELCLDDGPPIPVERDTEGWIRVEVPHGRAGSRYRYRIDGERLVPDPASRFQPDDVHGPSEVIDPEAFDWTDGGWRGRAWEELVFYELHVGTFTPEGTLDAATARLDHLAALGITAVELMPLGDFPGRWGWGYDGVLPFAPESRYGRPAALKSFVQACHARGLAVFLDVVYNHFGPDGNYLGLYAPQFFSARHSTPWGRAINFDGDESRWVRAFFRENALYWLDEFRLDGLRLDAVHAIHDESAVHIVDEIIDAGHPDPGRPPPGVRGGPPEPRPDRQSRVRRAPDGVGSGGGGGSRHGARAAGPVTAAALHGRGVGGALALPLFLRLRARPGICRDRGPAARVRTVCAVPGRTEPGSDPRSPGRRVRSAIHARLERPRAPGAPAPRGVDPKSLTNAPAHDRPVARPQAGAGELRPAGRGGPRRGVGVGGGPDAPAPRPSGPGLSPRAPPERARPMPLRHAIRARRPA